MKNVDTFNYVHTKSQRLKCVLICHIIIVKL